ncbi:MAG: hypothetical protein LUG96_10775 [Tannerellaceae bacterium]|nr:hypothetical protein [Tannerellaceae bacterium]
MKKVLYLLLFSVCFLQGWAQYKVSPARDWDRFPPEVQKPGFGSHTSQLVQMDNDPALEEVILFSAHNGHYPYFDLFKNYYVILDHYTKEVKYISDVTISTERDLILEDRNMDGKYELYRRYFQDGQFSTDESGNKLAVTWMYDRIEFDSQEWKNN